MNAMPSTTPRLNLEAIVEAALELIHSDGFDALSMRKLAQRCGVGAMTLYGYVRTKEELLTVIAEQFLAEIEPPDTRLPWQDQLKALFRSVHGVFLRHPELADIVARQHVNAAAAFRGAEFVFAALSRAGLNPDEAMSAFIALIAYTAGFSQREGYRGRDPSIQTRRMARLNTLPAGEFRHVSRLATAFLQGPTEQQFEDGLDLLVRGIASRASS
jgi:AcrR family transcriptional regulator